MGRNEFAHFVTLTIHLLPTMKLPHYQPLRGECLVYENIKRTWWGKMIGTLTSSPSMILASGKFFVCPRDTKSDRENKYLIVHIEHTTKICHLKLSSFHCHCCFHFLQTSTYPITQTELIKVHAQLERWSNFQMKKSSSGAFHLVKLKWFFLFAISNFN